MLLFLKLFDAAENDVVRRKERHLQHFFSSHLITNLQGDFPCLYQVYLCELLHVPRDPLGPLGLPLVGEDQDEAGLVVIAVAAADSRRDDAVVLERKSTWSPLFVSLCTRAVVYPLGGALHVLQASLAGRLRQVIVNLLEGERNEVVSTLS